MSIKVICIAKQKGGLGKTTTAVLFDRMLADQCQATWQEKEDELSSFTDYIYMP